VINTLKQICEICDVKLFSLDRHHIISKSKGGNNKPYNIAKLCQVCHRKIHTGQIRILGKFLSTNGWILEYEENDDVSNISDQTCYIIGNNTKSNESRDDK